MAKAPKGRPLTWHKQVTAPALALEFYAMIAKLQKSDAFAECHVYHGARLGDEPVIKFNKKVTGLPSVIASYIGLPSAGRRCTTPGCCNPFHYIPPGASDETYVHKAETPEHVVEVGMDEWIDLIEYHLDNHALRIENVTMEAVRAMIPVEDLSDSQLKSAYDKMKGE